MRKDLKKEDKIYLMKLISTIQTLKDVSSAAPATYVYRQGKDWYYVDSNGDVYWKDMVADTTQKISSKKIKVRERNYYYLNPIGFYKKNIKTSKEKLIQSWAELLSPSKSLAVNKEFIEDIDFEEVDHPKKEKGYWYYVKKDGRVYRQNMKTRKEELVSNKVTKKEKGFSYYVAKNGDVERKNLETSKVETVYRWEDLFETSGLTDNSEAVGGIDFNSVDQFLETKSFDSSMNTKYSQQGVPTNLNQIKGLDFQVLNQRWIH